MKRLQTLGLMFAAVSALGALGCGDDVENGATCGAGTTLQNGVCVGGPAITCTDGTELNDEHTGCVPSDSVCPEGTVLVGAQCQDEVPGMADVTEAAEPNGLDVGGEESTTAAATLTLKAEGQTLVVKGVLNPFVDNLEDGQLDPDYDTYKFHANGPLLLDISADGTHGIAPAFLVQIPLDADPADPLTGYQRYGISVTSDTSHRQLFIPGAGDYILTVGDVRSMYLDGSSPPAAGAGGAAGSADAAYYLSITAKPIPAASAITVTAGEGTVSGTLAAGDAPKFYTVTNGAGFNSAVLLHDSAAFSGALVVTSGTTIRAQGSETADAYASTQTLAGATDTIVVDPVYNYSSMPANFELDFTAGTAGVLSATGTAVSQPGLNNAFSVFAIDVAAADELDAVALSFNVPVRGIIVRADQTIFAPLNFNTDFGSFQGTFQSYTGLIRFPTAGRYYVFVALAAGATAGPITATSTITKLTPATIVKGVVSAAQPLNPTVKAAAFNYSPGAAMDPWQLFNVSGNGTGPFVTSFYDPATAYGTLSTLTLTGTGGTLPPDADATFTKTFPAAGAPQGQVLAGTVPTTYLVTVTAPAASTTSAITVDFKKRDITNLNNIANGANATATNQSITTTTTARYYLAKLTAGSVATITVQPATGTDVKIELLNYDETLQATFNGATAIAPDVGMFQAGPEGYVAFRVVPTGAIVGTLAYSVTVAAAAPPTYTVTAGTTAFADVCATGTDVSPTNDDEGLSAPIAPPANFKYYGVTTGSFVASTNGFLTFKSDGNAHFTNVTMPTAATPNSIIAPFWDDLELVTICTKTTGTKTVVQWTGDLYDDFEQTVEVQAILDSSNNSIEFVYGGGQDTTGDSATIGIEDGSGTIASLISFDTANDSVGKKFTPN